MDVNVAKPAGNAVPDWTLARRRPGHGLLVEARRDARLRAQARREVEVLVALEPVDLPARDPLGSDVLKARREKEIPPVRRGSVRRGRPVLVLQPDLRPLDGTEKAVRAPNAAREAGPALDARDPLPLSPGGGFLAAGVELRVEVGAVQEALERPRHAERVERPSVGDREALAVGEVRHVDAERRVRPDEVRVREEDGPRRPRRLLLEPEAELHPEAEQVVLLGADRVFRDAALVRERPPEEERPGVGRSRRRRASPRPSRKPGGRGRTPEGCARSRRGSRGAAGRRA